MKDNKYREVGISNSLVFNPIAGFSSGYHPFTGLEFLLKEIVNVHNGKNAAYFLLNFLVVSFSWAFAFQLLSSDNKAT